MTEKFIEMRDLFGKLVEIPDERAMTPRERRRLQRRATEVAKGYVAKPGSGPAGETCGTCEHCAVLIVSKRLYKCRLNRRNWSHSVRTDIRVRSPACRHWQAITKGTTTDE